MVVYKEEKKVLKAIAICPFCHYLSFNVPPALHSKFLIAFHSIFPLFLFLKNVILSKH